MLNKVYSLTPLLLNIIGALGAISTGLEKYITAVGIEIKVEHLQNITLLETARVSRLVLGCQEKQHHKYEYHSARPLATGCFPLSQN